MEVPRPKQKSRLSNPSSGAGVKIKAEVLPRASVAPNPNALNAKPSTKSPNATAAKAAAKASMAPGPRATTPPKASTVGGRAGSPSSPVSPTRASQFKRQSSVRRKTRTKKRGDRLKTTGGISSEDRMNSYRLSVEDVIPNHYTICIKPNLEEFTFEGCVSVNVKLIKETPTISLNLVDLIITKVMWEEDVTEKKRKPATFAIDADRQIINITFEPPIPPTDGCIRLNFNGIISDKSIGLCLSKYLINADATAAEEAAAGPVALDDDGAPITPSNERFLLITKFEPTFARMCFPCWDEPAIKCTYDLSLILPKTTTALSNMPVKVIYPHRSKPNLHVVEFVKSPPMSTYLLAFAIGQFEYLECIASPTPDGGIPISAAQSLTEFGEFIEELGVHPAEPEPTAMPITCRIYTTPGKRELGQFALDTCATLLAFYQKYFNSVFPVRKLDLLAIPELNTGGNENWGLIMLKESRVLLNEHELSFSSRKQVAILIANQLARQWFGNLVSVEWWSFLWYAEGVSTYMEYLAIDHLFPDYDIWTVFYTKTFLEVLAYDALKASHPLEMLIFQPNEIRDNFDYISLDKGASLLSMLKNYVGERLFRKALSLFLVKHKHKSADSNELWRCFELVSNKPIGAIMQSWTKKQMGYPLVRVTAMMQDGQSRVLTLSQEKFWADPLQREARGTAKEYLWSIPLTFSTGSSPSAVAMEVLMEKKAIQVVIPRVPKSQWVKVNPGGIGYYRVMYLPEMILQFHQNIRNRSVPPLDRVGMLNDLFAFAQAGFNSVLELFNLLEAYVDEDNYIVWTEIVATLDKLDRLLWDVDYYPHFKSYWRITLNTIMEKVGWYSSETEEPSRMKLRALIMNRLVLAHHEHTLFEADQRYFPHISGKEIVPLELRSVVYQGAMIKGIQLDIVKTLLRRYKDFPSLEEKECIIHSFDAVSDPELVYEILEFAKTDAVRPTEAKQIVRTLANTKDGREVTWQFFKGNQAAFKAWFGQGVGYTKIVQAITENFTTSAKATEVYEYFKDKFVTIPGLERTLLQVEERIHINEQWLHRESALIEDYLSTYE